MSVRAHGAALRWGLAAAVLGAVAGGFPGDARATITATRPPDTEPRFLIVRPSVSDAALALYAHPEGPVLTTASPWTQFGGRLALSVVRVDGGWLAVTALELANGEVGWVRREDVRIASTRVSLVADLSARTLVVRVGERAIRRIRVSVGAPGTPTPVGRFAVIDKFPGTLYGPYLGCCVLVLSGRQPNLPAGWQGGDLLGIHGTNAPGTVGRASSAGCLRASDRDMRFLMRRVAVGTPVFIRP